MPVLIVGGGPVGLALAAELGWRGIRCELVEQGDGAITTPKMNEVNTRTMEFCRRWGVADAVRHCPFPDDHPLDVVFVTSLAGHELARMRRPPRAQQQADRHSPVRPQICSQIWFDPILRAFAQAQPSVTLRHRTRLESFAESAGGVTAELHDLDGGKRETIRADYLVGCDGATSAIRDALGIGLGGEGVLGHPLHLFFRAPDLLARCGREPGVFFLAIDRGGLWANIRVIDPANGLWRLMALESDGKQTADSVDRAALLQRAVGRPIDVEWRGVSIWKRRSVVAERYAHGRVFLAGDAVHQLSPTGALGMNTGIGDAVDLGWKLAAVLAGWGGPNLLASYDGERRPIGVRNVGMATEFYLAHGEFAGGMAAIEDDSEAGRALRRRLGDSLARDVGRMFRTAGPATRLSLRVIADLRRRWHAAGCRRSGTFVASARPGSRAPHAWLGDGRSTLDLFGRGFVLLRFGDADTTALEEAAASAQQCRWRSSISTSRRPRPSTSGAWCWCGLTAMSPGAADVIPGNADALIDRVRGAA